MAVTSDKVFLRSFRWLGASVQWMQDNIPDVGVAPLPAFPLGTKLGDALRTKLGLELDKTAATVVPKNLRASNAAAGSLAVATMVTGETLAALKTLGAVLDDVAAGTLSIDDLSAVIKQIDRIVNADPGKPPSAYSVAKLLLILSGDVDAPDADAPARRLIYTLLGKNPDAVDASTEAKVPEMQAVMGLAIIAVGTIIDRAFPTPGAAATRALPRGLGLELPDVNKSREFVLAHNNDNSKALKLKLGFESEKPPTGPAKLFAEINAKLDTSSSLSSEFQLALVSAGKFVVAFELPSIVPLPAALPKPEFSGAVDIGLKFSRKSTVKPLVLGKADGTHFSIGEISGAITLKNTTPQVEFDLKDSKLVLHIGDDALLSAVIGERIEVALNFGLIADVAGGLRMKDGTGLKATIPLQKIPNSPVQIPFLTFELKKADGLNKIEMELSGSFQVSIGPFSGSIDRLGSQLTLKNMLSGVPDQLWGLKPPSGAGLVLDAGIVKGGGFLLFDPDRGEYGGILDIKIAAIGVKAIGLLNTKNPGGWSLLLIITAQLPPIQLGFGFTLTGIGGLLGVQHTVSIDALSSGLNSGSLDSFLFPQNPVANAPQIFNQLRVIFPFKAGGFIIGPMLELGWGTPSLVTARVGVLIEPSQLVFVGQIIVQLPPLVDKSLALLRLQVDFAGGIVFDPLKIWFDGVLRDSRVLFISLTGQFAFRAMFGNQPSFLISAGGFHPKFTDLPPGLPSPFQRIGAEFSIGIVGMQFTGYFAVTSATVQGGSAMRVWGDVGIASFEGGFEFNAIIYLTPKFRFQCDLHVYASVEVFDIDFASVDIYGQFEGPGRWRIIGRAVVHTPWPLPDFRFRVDESWGEDRTTNVRVKRLVDELRPELESAGNWSAQLPVGAESFATFAKLPPPADGQADKRLITHPNATLQFMQKRMPLAKKIDKLGTDTVEGDTQIGIDQVLFGSEARTPDTRIQHSFAVGQFINMNEDDLLHKPSFDNFEAGFTVGQNKYVFGAMVADSFDYEERNLSTLAVPSLIAASALMSGSLADWGLSLGAAARSAKRRPTQLRPEVERKIKVNPSVLQTLDLGSGTMQGSALAGAAATSFWQAQDLVGAQGKNQQIVEAIETLAAF